MANQQNPLASFGGMFGDIMGRLMQPGAMGVPQQQTFVKKYKVFAVACAQNKASLEAGDKILLPASALDQLARLRVTYPMMFQVSNCSPGADPRTHKTHCGVMEFSSEEGIAYLPYWMMQNLLVENGGIVEIRNVSLPKGNFVQFQPHSTKFTSLHNPRVVLERALRNYACLTKGDTIAIQHGDESYYLDVVETKPNNAISIIETDVNVDFIPAKDAPKEEYKKPAQAQTNDFKFHIPDDEVHKSGTVVEAASAPASSSPTSTTPVTNSYFAKLGAGNRLTNKKPINKSPSLNSTSQPTATTTGTSTSTSTTRPASQSVATSSSATPTSRPASASVSSSSSSSSSPSADGFIYEDGPRWTYVYKMENGQKKLVKRAPKTASSFKPFGGSGNTLK